MSVHRMLQRAYARLYKYKLHTDSSSAAFVLTSGVDYATDYGAAVLDSHSSKDLNVKMQGARTMSAIVLRLSDFRVRASVR